MFGELLCGEVKEVVRDFAKDDISVSVARDRFEGGEVKYHVLAKR